jgi:hypothetical protein
MPSILGANSVSGYEIANSLRFNDGDSPSLTKSFGSAGNRAIWTWSAWIKVGSQAGLTNQFNPIFTAGNWSSGSTATGLVMYNNQFYTYWNAPNGATTTSGYYRDPSAWYHLVLVANTSTLKLYINGSEITSKSISGNGEINNGSSEQAIGKYSGSTSAYFDGYIGEVNFIDGTAKAATDFGETNDNGVWIPKEYTGSYGTNGFFLEFQGTGTSQNSSGMGADTSGNDNHFAVTNLAATDVTTDTPTNNFCTLNSLSDISTSVTFSEGNTKASIGAGSTNRAVGNIGFTSGKWYYEVKYVSTSASASYLEVGFVNTDISMRYHVRGSDGERWDNGSPSSSTSYRHDPDDIIGVYIDADNKKWYIQVNGSNEDVGNGVADVSAGTGFVHQNFAVTDFILPYFANASGSGGHVFQVNFGNPPFAISSGNADANGYGSFEYNPTNDGVDFYALCTKNLAEYG